MAGCVEVQVATAVRENGLDSGVIFDGDADRAMFVDERVLAF